MACQALDTALGEYRSVGQRLHRAVARRQAISHPEQHIGKPVPQA
jgi:hypothetical protein